MVRWRAENEGKLLASLFENGMADPEFSEAADIDPIKETMDEFKAHTNANFRKNYKKTARSWITAKGLHGIRRKDLHDIAKERKKSTEEEQEPLDEYDTICQVNKTEEVILLV